MNEVKYVIVIPPGMNERGARAIVFNGIVNHSDVVPKEFKVKSAGFCYLDSITGKWMVYGRSTSLKVESRPNDGITIERTLNNTLDSVGIYETKNEKDGN